MARGRCYALALPLMDRSTNSFVAAVAAVIVLAAAIWFWRREPAAPEAMPGATTSRASTESRPGPLRTEGYIGAEPLGFLTDKASSRPLHRLSRYPPLTFIPVHDLPKVTRGIPCPDGSFLPFLNGMTAAPAIHRDPAYGPVPPIVGIWVDVSGIEWWEHADGSKTTTHYLEAEAFGKKYFDPVTRHGLPKPRDQVLDLPPNETVSREPPKK